METRSGVVHSFAQPASAESPDVGLGESQKLDDIRFWDAAMGEGFSQWYEWYLKEGIESARDCGESDGQTEQAESVRESSSRQLQLF